MDIARLALEVDSRSARSAAADLDGMTAAGRRAEGQFNGVKRGGISAAQGLNTVDKAAISTSAAFARLGGIVGSTLATAFSVDKVLRYADSWTELQNRLRLVTEGQRELAKATNDVYRIALTTNQNLDSSAQVYQRFAQNADSLGVSLDQVAALTETVSKAVAVSGASAGAAEAALTQFGQALASGVFRGEEFNSVMEQTPALAQAIATGMGVAVGELRALAADGQLTADVLVEALTNARNAVDEQFNTRVKTLSQSFTNLETTLNRYIGEANIAVGGTNALGGAVDALTQYIESLRDDIDGLSNDVVAVGAAFDGVAYAVSETYDAINGFGERFSRMLGVSEQEVNGLGLSITQSFTDSFLATARELDGLAEMFTGTVAGIESLFNALGENIATIFRNAFDQAMAHVSDAIFQTVDAVNGTFNTSFGVRFFGGPGNDPLVGLGDAFSRGFDDGKRSFGAQDALLRRIGNSAIERSLAEQEYVAGLDVSGGADRSGVLGGGTAAGKKGKTKNTDPLGDFMKSMNIDYAMGEYQKYLDFLDEATGRSKDRILVTQAEWLQNALNIGAITSEEYSKALDQLVDKTDKSMGQMDQFTVQAARNIQNALGDGLYKILKGNFDDIGQAFGDTITRMVADAAAANLAGALFGDYGSTGQIGGILGNIAGSLFGGVAGLDAASQVQMAGGDGIGTLIGANGWASGGYTGAGGKFEPAGVVHRGEYVFDQESTGRLGVPFLESLRRGYAGGGVVHAPAQVSQPSLQLNLINQSSQPVQAKPGAMSFDGKRWIQEVVLSDLRTNGPIARSMKGVMA